MKDEKMGKITILLSPEADKKIREQSKKNFRSISKEIEYLIMSQDKVK